MLYSSDPSSSPWVCGDGSRRIWTNEKFPTKAPSLRCSCCRFRSGRRRRWSREMMVVAVGGSVQIQGDGNGESAGFLSKSWKVLLKSLGNQRLDSIAGFVAGYSDFVNASVSKLLVHSVDGRILLFEKGKGSNLTAASLHWGRVDTLQNKPVWFFGHATFWCEFWICCVTVLNSHEQVYTQLATFFVSTLLGIFALPVCTVVHMYSTHYLILIDRPRVRVYL